MNENKWSILKILMLVLSFFLILSKVYMILYFLRLSGMTVTVLLLLPLSIEIVLLGVLIFVPSKYRFLAILPLLYFIVANTFQLVHFINSPSYNLYPSILIFQQISSNILAIISYITYAILLATISNYKIKHAVIAGLLIIPAFLIYLLNFTNNLGQMFYQDFEFAFRIIVVYLITNTGIPIIFTLYFLSHIKRKRAIQ